MKGKIRTSFQDNMLRRRNEVVQRILDVKLDKELLEQDDSLTEEEKKKELSEYDTELFVLTEIKELYERGMEI